MRKTEISFERHPNGDLTRHEVVHNNGRLMSAHHDTRGACPHGWQPSELNFDQHINSWEVCNPCLVEKVRDDLLS